VKLPIKTIQSKAKAKRNRDNWKARAEQLQAAVKRKDKLIAELWFHRNAWLNAEANRKVFNKLKQRINQEGVEV